MTNDLTIEQAVGELKAMKKHIEPYMSVVGVTAYDMAIKALEDKGYEQGYADGFAECLELNT